MTSASQYLTSLSSRPWPALPLLLSLILLPALSTPCAARDISLDAGPVGAPAALDPQRAGEVVINALTLAGLRYAYASQSVTNGMDCSALVQHVFRQSWQRELPRTAEQQSRAGDLVLPHELQAGDLVFFNTSGQRFSHVGIYVGEGRFVHSPASGGAIRVDSMNKTYWTQRYNGARRIPEQALSVNLD
jgi:cell wall-associated NlpC family hydrolase